MGGTSSANPHGTSLSVESILVETAPYTVLRSRRYYAGASPVVPGSSTKDSPFSLLLVLHIIAERSAAVIDVLRASGLLESLLLSKRKLLLAGGVVQLVGHAKQRTLPGFMIIIYASLYIVPIHSSEQFLYVFVSPVIMICGK